MRELLQTSFRWSCLQFLVCVYFASGAFQQKFAYSCLRLFNQCNPTKKNIHIIYRKHYLLYSIYSLKFRELIIFYILYFIYYILYIVFCIL